MIHEIINKDVSSFTKDDNLYITLIANSGLPDISGDMLTEKAMQSIMEQATTHNLHLEHDKTFNGVLGPIVDVNRCVEGIKLTSKIRPEKREYVETLLNDGVNVGSSVSIVPIRDKQATGNINDLQLIEVSLTPIPNDQTTMGKTSILSKSLKELLDKEIASTENNIETNNDNDNKNNNETKEEKSMADGEFVTKEAAIDLFNSGINEIKESLLDDMKNEFKSEIQAMIKEEIEKDKASKTEEKKDETESKQEEKESAPVDKEINLEALLEKSAEQGATTVLEKVFGNKDQVLNVKYEDKSFKFVESLNENPQEKKEEKETVKTLPPEEIARMM